MEEAEILFNQRLYQHLDVLDYSFSELTPTRGKVHAPPVRAMNDSAVGLEFQWLSPQAQLMARSKMMPEQAITALREGFTFSNFAGYRWHVLVARSRNGASWFIVAERDDQRFRMAEAVILPAVYPMVAAIPVLGLLIWALLGLGLRPVARLAIDLERREATDLHPVPTHDMPKELRLLAQATNALLRRLAASFAREKRFSADAAHELRTPIAALRIQVDNLIDTLPEAQADIAKLQQGIERMQHLVEQILLLNRIAPDQFVAQFKPLDLCACVRTEIARYSEALNTKALDIELVENATMIHGDQDAIAALLRNLIDNAIKYTPHGGKIRVQTSMKETRVRLEIADSGPGIPEELRARALDRFYRVGGDQHTPAIPGCGLGLSIVQQVAELHGAYLSLEDSPFGTGLAVAVEFPDRSGAN